MGRPKNDSVEAIAGKLTGRVDVLAIQADGFTLALAQYREAFEKLEHRIELLEKQGGVEAARMAERVAALEDRVWTVQNQAASIAKEAADARTQRDLERRLGNLEHEVDRCQSDIRGIKR